MKLSIWQQYSSNHSAHYQVVGKFRDEVSARKALAQLREIALQVRESTPIPDDSFPNKEAYLPTDIEKKFARQYDIEWEHGLDWGYWSSAWNKVSVEVYADTLWFRNPHPYTWQGPGPVVDLMNQMGAEEVAVFAGLCKGIPSYPDTRILVDVSFRAPDTQQAEVLRETFRIEFEVGVDHAMSEIYIEDDSLTGIPFWFYRVPDAKLVEPNIDLFKVLDEGVVTRLIGLSFEFADMSSESALKRLVDYLLAHDCTDIEYTLRSEMVHPPDKY